MASMTFLVCSQCGVKMHSFSSFVVLAVLPPPPPPSFDRASSASPSHSANHMWLPAHAKVDESECVYWYNPATSQTVWEFPRLQPGLQAEEPGSLNGLMDRTSNISHYHTTKTSSAHDAVLKAAKQGTKTSKTSEFPQCFVVSRTTHHA